MSRFGFLIILAVLVVGTAFLFLQKNKKSDSQLAATATTKPGMDQWQSYQSPDNVFSVDLPAIPHHTSDTFQEKKSRERIRYELYLATSDSGVMYTISVLSLPEGKGTAYDQNYIKEYLKEMFGSNPSNQIQALEESKSAQGDAVKFTVQNTDAIVDGNAFISGKALYVLSATARQAQRAPTEYRKFFDSFKLK